MLDLTLVDELFYGACHILDRHVRVHTVLIEQVDMVGPQTFQCRVGDFPDALRAAIQPRLCIARSEAEFRCDHHAVAKRGQGFADKFFVHEGTVGFGGVEESHTELGGRPNQLDRVLPASSGPIAITQPHAAEADGRDFEVAAAQLALMHRCSRED